MSNTFYGSKPRALSGILPQTALPLFQVIVAGTLESFQIFVWAVKTAQLLDVLAGHEGPVVALQFSPTQSLLASASWDKTVRTWDLFG